MANQKKGARKIMFAFLFAALFLVTSFSTYSQTTDWEYNGPEFDSVSAIAFDPQDSCVVYAGTSTGILKGTCMGLPFPGFISWAESGLDNHNVTSLAVDHQVTSIVYAGTSSGIYKSTDSGATWNLVSGVTGYIYTVEMDPVDPMTLYTFTNVQGRLYKSQDGGSTWTIINSGISSYWFRSLAIDPQNTSTLYVGTNYAGGIFKSTDGGSTWTALNDPTLTRDISILEVDPTNSNIVYASRLTYGLYKSTDGGTTWNSINSGLTMDRIVSFVIDPLNPNILYAGADFTGGYGISKSTNGGTSWTSINTETITVGHVSAIALDPQDSDHLFIGTKCAGEIFESTTGGTYWLLHGIRNFASPSVRFIKVQPGRRIAEIDSYDSNPAAPDSSSIPIEPIEPDTSYNIYCGTDNGLFKKTMNQYPYPYGTWVSLPITGTSADSFVDLLEIYSLNPNILYVSLSYDGIYKSTNGGTSWTHQSSGGASALAISPTNANTLYKITGMCGTVSKSTDGGVTWVNYHNGLTYNARFMGLAIDPRNANTLYVGSDTSGGLFKSTDGGVNWTQLTGGAPTSGINAIQVHPTNSNIVYVATSGGVYKTTDGGTSWVTINNGLTATDIRNLLIDPSNTNVIYVGTRYCSGPGVFKTTNGGGNWQNYSSGLTDGDILSLGIDTRASSKTVYAGTLNGAKLFYLSGE